MWLSLVKIYPLIFEVIIDWLILIFILNLREAYMDSVHFKCFMSIVKILMISFTHVTYF